MGRCYDFYVKFDGVEIKGYILLLDDLLQTSSATTHSTVLGRKYTGERREQDLMSENPVRGVVRSAALRQ